MDLTKIKEIDAYTYDLSECDLEKCSKCRSNKKLSAVKITDCYYIQCRCGQQSPFYFMGWKLPNACDFWNKENIIVSEARVFQTEEERRIAKREYRRKYRQRKLNGYR